MQAQNLEDGYWQAMKIWELLKRKNREKRKKLKNFSLGYKEYMLELFDENLVFLEGELWNI